MYIHIIESKLPSMKIENCMRQLVDNRPLSF